MNNIDRELDQIMAPIEGTVKLAANTVKGALKGAEMAAEKGAELLDEGYEDTTLNYNKELSSKEVLENIENAAKNKSKTIDLETFKEQNKDNFLDLDLNDKIMKDNDIALLLHNFKSYGLVFKINLISFKKVDIQLIDTDIEKVIAFIKNEEFQDTFSDITKNITGTSGLYDYELDRTKRLNEDTAESFKFAAENIEDKIDDVFSRLEEEVFLFIDTYIKNISEGINEVKEKESKFVNWIDKRLLNNIVDDRVQESSYEYNSLLNKYSKEYNKMVEEKQNYLNDLGGDSLTRTIRRAFFPAEKQKKLIHLRKMYKTVKKQQRPMKKYIKSSAIIIIDDLLIDFVEMGYLFTREDLHTHLLTLKQNPSLINQELIVKFNDFIDKKIMVFDTQFNTTWRK